MSVFEMETRKRTKLAFFFVEIPPTLTDHVTHLDFKNSHRLSEKLETLGIMGEKSRVHLSTTMLRWSKGFQGGLELGPP